MYVCPFISRAGNSLLFGSRSYAESVVRKFDGVNAPEAAPEQVFLRVFFDIKGIDGILHIDLVAAKQLAVIGKRAFGFIGGSHAYPAGPFPTPYRHGIVQHIPSVNGIDIGRPQTAFRFKCRTGCIGKCSANKFPVH
ncbi:hypothetical protein SDC9_130756 [bioreactor metagenome]|uniref:Uncharacterized protein n=1 Tax=bioreactor metagenome TaxID=1076179 RepID=A0A645D3G0_9ZZZZ